MHECRGRRDAQERLSWAQRLKRVFRIEVDTCEHCGGKAKIIASIEDPAVVGRMVAQLEEGPGRAVQRLMPTLHTVPAGRRGRMCPISAEEPCTAPGFTGAAAAGRRLMAAW